MASDPRKPVTDDYDAVVDLAPSPDHVPRLAYALVKKTFVVNAGQLEPIAATPLLHDIRYGPAGERPEKLPLGTDFWFQKRLTDVVISGSAWSVRPTHEMEVQCVVGNHHKRIAVMGRRHIEWRGGRARIGAAESFTTMPVDRAHAYGGVDTRVPYPPIRSVMDAVSLGVTHPGTYPRNDEGKGYYVVPEQFDGIELPNLEHPDDRLTDERLVVERPENWAGQPIPWTFDWVPHWTFPRSAHLGVRPRHDVAPEALSEVRLGLLDADFPSLWSDVPASEPVQARRDAFRDRFYQEASAGMQLGPLGEGVPVRVVGMRPGGDDLAFMLPAPPAMTVIVDGQSEQVAPRLSNLVIAPESGVVTVTYCACTTGLPRKLIPGIHAQIPLVLHVDGGDAINYVAPPPLRASSA